jgi:hypothetical protein
MNRIKATFRWTLVFGVLSAFTFYSLASFNIIKPANAYAQTISNNSNLSHSDKFVVVSDDNNPNSNKSDELCALTQEQLDILAAKFNIKPSTTEVDGKQVNIITIDKTHGLNKAVVYKALGINQGDVKCQLVKEQKKFLLLYLLPGVS